MVLGAEHHVLLCAVGDKLHGHWRRIGRDPLRHLQQRVHPTSVVYGARRVVLGVVVCRNDHDPTGLALGASSRDCSEHIAGDCTWPQARAEVQASREARICVQPPLQLLGHIAANQH